MKKQYALHSILVLLMILSSCSSDNNNSNIQNEDNEISQISIKTFDQGEIISYLYRFYENNKPKRDSIYNSSHELILYTNWIYNNNKLISRQSFYPIGSSDELNITYDNLGRINQSIREFGNLINTTNYNYNNDNTITSVSEVNGTISSKTFYTNENGIINKEISESGTYLVTYDNDNNVVSMSTPFGTTIYSYDDINIPPSNFPVYQHFMFGDYKNNYIIYNNSVEHATNNDSSLLIKYPLTNEIGSNITVLEWTLDSENYPIKRKVFIQNQLTIESDYFYN